MERNIKKEIGLNRFFILFLTHTAFSLICMGALWLFLLFSSSYLGIILPANSVEHSVSTWYHTLDGHRPVTPEEIPDDAAYALFDTDLQLLQTNMDENTLHVATELAAAGQPQNIARKNSQIYLCFHTDTQRVVIMYRLIALFASPLLRRLFPSAELFFFLLLFVMLIADLIWISTRYARKLNRELRKLAAAADQISRQNLDFPVRQTKIREFNQIMNSLDYLKEHLKRSLKEQWAMEQQKKQHLTALAHDIKTPLAIVTGNAELLLETRQTEEQQQYTTFILEHAGQIHHHVTGMLDLFHTGTFPAGQCAVKKLLTTTAQNTELIGKTKHLSCVLSMEHLPDTLPVPEDALRRILDNLTDNAVQYSPENGTIFLHALCFGRLLQLSVQDEGNGFSREALALATTAFYRSDQSRNSKEHFGLGLSITKQIVTGLGGKIRLENAPEKGAHVTVWIPLDGDQPEEDEN